MAALFDLDVSDEEGGEAVGFLESMSMMRKGDEPSPLPVQAQALVQPLAAPSAAAARASAPASLVDDDLQQLQRLLRDGDAAATARAMLTLARSLQLASSAEPRDWFRAKLPVLLTSVASPVDAALNLLAQLEVAVADDNARVRKEREELRRRERVAVGGLADAGEAAEGEERKERRVRRRRGRRGGGRNERKGKEENGEDEDDGEEDEEEEEDDDAGEEKEGGAERAGREAMGECIFFSSEDETGEAGVGEDGDEPDLAHRLAMRINVDLRVMLVRALETVGVRPTPEQQQRAAAMRAQLSPRVFAELARALQLPAELADLGAFATQLLEARREEDAAMCIRVAGLYRDFAPERVLGPLLARKRFDLVESYVLAAKDPAIARFAVERAAEWRGGDDPVRAGRWAVQFGFRTAEFPRIDYLRRKSALWWTTRLGCWPDFVSFLLAAPPSSDEAPEEQRAEAASNSRKLQRYLARQLLKRGQRAQCAWVIARYGLARDAESSDVASAVQDELRAVGDAASGEPERPRRAAPLVGPELPVFALERDKVRWVNDAAAPAWALAQRTLRSKRVDVLGLDLEHMPENLAGLHPYGRDVQTLQVASRQFCFVFDLQCMCAEWDELLGEVLSNHRIVKVGMGFARDLARLAHELPQFACFRTEVPAYLELERVLAALPESEEDRAIRRRYKELKRFRERRRRRRAQQPPLQQGGSRGGSDVAAALPPDDALEHGGGRKEGGLARLVRVALRKRLDKSEQISNWGRRPLRPEQLAYAAADAMCQIPIFDWLRQRGGDGSRMPIETLPAASPQH